MNVPAVPLSELLKRSVKLISLDPETEYREVTVRLWGKGVVERGRVGGATNTGARRFVASAGQLVLSRIDARNGALGLIPKSLDGAVVSNDFPLFDINRERLLPEFLGWLIQTTDFVELCQRASEGTTNRVRLQEDRFLSLEIPLPPLPDQRRVVARIEAVAGLVGEAREIRQAAIRETEAIAQTALNLLLSESALSRWPKRRLGDCAAIRSGVTLGRKLVGRLIDLPYLRVANVQDGRLDLSQVKRVAVLESEVEKWRLLPGDILLTEGGDWDKLGRGTVWRGEIPDCIHQNHIFRLRIDQEELLPDYLARLLGSPMGKQYFQGASKQTTNLASINQRQLKAFEIFQPPIPEQRRLIAEFDALQQEATNLKAVQSESSATLDALLPAVLDRAFRGEL